MNIADIIYKECREVELDPAEKKQLNLWLEENPKNKKVYSQMKLSLLYPDDREMDEVELSVWNDLKLKLNRKDSSNRTSSALSIAFKIAAILLLGIAAAFSIYNLSFRTQGDTRLVEVRMIEKVSVAGQKITTTLPDGTKVKLNSDSRLIVPEKFDSSKRVVELSGEAFFEVAENKEWPFVVKSAGMEVKVLGTSFNVRAYEEDQVSKVAVKTGKVEVKGIADEEQRVTLLPNDISSWNRVASSLNKSEIEAMDQVFGWTEQKLVFENESLPEVLRVLSRWYGVKFVDSYNLTETAKRKYTAKYMNPTLEQMMLSLAHVYDFDFEIDEKENKITLK